MKVSLGGIEVPVAPQPYPLLIHDLPEAMGDLGEVLQATEGLDELLPVLGGKTYEVLKVLIPAMGHDPETGEALLPEWRFKGFASKEAMDAGEYDRAAASRAPTVPEIKEAFQVAAEVNGVDFLGKLKNLLDPTLLQAIVSGAIEDAVKTVSTSTPGSSSSPSTSGGSAQPKSSIPSPTTAKLPGSLSPV